MTEEQLKQLGKRKATTSIQKYDTTQPKLKVKFDQSTSDDQLSSLSDKCHQLNQFNHNRVSNLQKVMEKIEAKKS